MARRSRNFHKHKCDTCGFVWSHSNDQSESTSAHTCPKCSDIQRRIYFGDDQVGSDWDQQARPSMFKRAWNYITEL
mgnify:CR=1 FL=1